MYRNTAGDKLYRDVLGEERKDERPKNYDDWNATTKEAWKKKDVVELENYYGNLKGYVSKLKKNPRNGVKPRGLIAKKKAWRNGIFELLCNDPLVGKHYRKTLLPKDTPVIPPPRQSSEQKELEKERARKAKQDLHCDEELEDTEDNH